MVNVWPKPQPSGTYESFAYEDTKEEEREVAELKKKLSKLKIVARAKVTMDRVYCAQYHPEKSKDLIFFGGKAPFPPIPSPHRSYQFVAQINMANWVSGTLGHLWMKLGTMRRPTQKRRKVENIGDYKCTGLPPPGRRFRAFDLIPRTPIAQVVQNILLAVSGL